MSGNIIIKAINFDFQEANVRTEKQNFRTMIMNYISPITITAVNTILPTVFYKLSEFEDLNPRVKVNWDLGR